MSCHVTTTISQNNDNVELKTNEERKQKEKFTFPLHWLVYFSPTKSYHCLHNVYIHWNFSHVYTGRGGCGDGKPNVYPFHCHVLGRHPSTIVLDHHFLITIE